MEREERINGLSVKVNNNSLIIGNDRLYYINRHFAPALIAFIQQWLDHDPEQELLDAMAEAYNERYDGAYQEAPHIEGMRAALAAVREHDAKYGRPE